MQKEWLRLAQQEVEASIRALPEDVRAAANECPVQFETYAEASEYDSDIDEDTLGLFEGANRLDPEADLPEAMPRIRLFLDNILELAEGDHERFCREVRQTWLHEFGHYLGWDEEEVTHRGLA